MSNLKESLKDDSSIIDEKEFKKLLSQDLINKINFVSETKRNNSNNCSDGEEESNKNIKKKPNKNEFNNEEIIPEKEKNKYHFNREINNQQNKFTMKLIAILIFLMHALQKMENQAGFVHYVNILTMNVSYI